VGVTREWGWRPRWRSASGDAAWYPAKLLEFSPGDLDGIAILIGIVLALLLLIVLIIPLLLLFGEVARSWPAVLPAAVLATLERGRALPEPEDTVPPVPLVGARPLEGQGPLARGCDRALDRRSAAAGRRARAPVAREAVDRIDR
jgi:hypothetical protein